MTNSFTAKVEQVIKKSKVLNSEYQETDGQKSLLFGCLLDDNAHKGALFMHQDDDFGLLQIFVRYPHPIANENLPQVLAALNSINSISIAGYLMTTAENGSNYIHYKSNMLLSIESIDSNFPENELLVFMNSNLDMIDAFYNEIFKQ